jgi:hypothetical protein
VRGPSDEQLAHARLAALARQAIADLAGLSEASLERLDDELYELPEVDLSLHARLPELPGPDRRRLQRAMNADSNADGAWESIKAIVRRVDTPQERARLAEAALRARDRGRITDAEAAYAVYDLSSGSTRLMTASAIHALATHFGGDPTPGGLLVAA